MPEAEQQPIVTRARRIIDKWREECTRCISKYTGLETFTSQPGDVFIITYAKSGTTLLQQMTYQILAAAGRVPTDPTGELFDDISEVVPFIEVRESCNIRHSVHNTEPRLWKSHGTPDKYDLQTGRFIYIVRNGLDVAASFLDFTAEWITGLILEEDVRAEVYRLWFLEFFLGLKKNKDGVYVRGERLVGFWFQHVKSWMQTASANVLFLVYEDIIEDLEGTIRKVAEFMGVEYSDALVRPVAAKCDRNIMASDPRFRDVSLSKLNGWDMNGGLRVRPAGSAGFKHVGLSEESLTIYYDMMRENLDVDSYEGLARLVRTLKPVPYPRGGS